MRPVQLLHAGASHPSAEGDLAAGGVRAIPSAAVASPVVQLLDVEPQDACCEPDSDDVASDPLPGDPALELVPFLAAERSPCAPAPLDSVDRLVDASLLRSVPRSGGPPAPPAPHEFPDTYEKLSDSLDCVDPPETTLHCVPVLAWADACVEPVHAAADDAWSVRRGPRRASPSGRAARRLARRRLTRRLR